MDALKSLYETVLMRRSEKTDGSYTCYLFEKGLDKILKKCGEECSEAIIAAKNNNKQEIVMEISDLLYHITVLMVDRDITLKEIEQELEKRSAKTGNLKTFHEADKNT